MALNPLSCGVTQVYTVLASLLELGPMGGGGARWPPQGPCPHLRVAAGKRLPDPSLQASSGALVGDTLCHSNNFIKVAEGRNNPTSRQLGADRCYSF